MAALRRFANGPRRVLNQRRSSIEQLAFKWKRNMIQSSKQNGSWCGTKQSVQRACQWAEQTRKERQQSGSSRSKGASGADKRTKLLSFIPKAAPVHQQGGAAAPKLQHAQQKASRAKRIGPVF